MSPYILQKDYKNKIFNSLNFIKIFSFYKIKKNINPEESIFLISPIDWREDRKRKEKK
jgi:hypothetical protein